MIPRRTLSIALLTVTACGCGYVEPEAVAPALAPAPLAVVGTVGAGAVAAARAGSVAGVLRGPVAGLIAENAASVIGGNTAGVIGGNTGNVISSNTAGVIGGNTGSYVLAGAPGRYTSRAAEALSAPIAGVAVALFDAAGRKLAEGVTTDAEGRFRFDALTTSERVLFVRGRYEQDGHAVELAATLPAPMAGEALMVAVDPATTLVAKKMRAMLGTHLINEAALDPAALAALAASLEDLLDARTVVAAAILPDAAVAQAFDRLAADHEGVGLELRKATDEPAGPVPSAMARATGRVETFAGGAEAGFADGRGDQARFAYPHGLALDEASHLYVADYNNHRIRRVAPDGEVTTLAGDGTPGFEDGKAGAARFRNPCGLAWHAGVLYVVDAGNRAVRRLREGQDGWTVETVAGGPAVAEADGFVAPRDLAIDAQAEPPVLYVADTGGLRVRQVALGEPGQPVTTACELAGGAPGQLAGPYAVAVDAHGALFVADATSNAIRRFVDGASSTFAGGGVVGLLDGDGLSARFAYPTALAFDRAGALFVADQLNHAVRRVQGGAVTTVAGRGAAGDEDGVGADAGFFRPSGLVVCPDGTLFVADTDNHRIRRIRP